MLITLAILLISALAGVGLGRLKQVPSSAGKLIILLGFAAALAAHLYTEGTDGGGVAGKPVVVPDFAAWLAAPTYRMDALASGLGAWCLLLGGLLVAARLASKETNSTEKAALYSLAAAVLYSLVHTFNLLALAVQILGLAVIVWALASHDRPGMQAHEVGTQSSHSSHSALAFGLGSLCLLGAVLVIGRTTGGQYDLAGLSLSALSGWPLIMIAAGVALWLGLAPFTAWSGRASNGQAALVQSLVIFVPAVTLLLRLEALVSAQGLAGSLPDGWTIFTGILSWLGGVSALAAAGGTVVWAGTSRWAALASATSGGLLSWSLGMDNPAGRQAAIAILLAFTAGRVALELLEHAGGASSVRADAYRAIYLPAARGVAVLSMAGIPVTAGFAGVWLLGTSLAAGLRASFVMPLAMTIILAACGSALHLAHTRKQSAVDVAQAIPSTASGLLGIAGSIALLVGGIAPVLWLDAAGSIAAVAGGNPRMSLPWPGMSAAGSTAPVLLLGLAVLVLGLLGWALRALLRRGVSEAGLLLPAALGRTRTGASLEDYALTPGFDAAPSPVWWLSLQWIDDGVWGLGALVIRLATRLGIGLERLEVRYYLPVAFVLAAIALFVITR